MSTINTKGRLLFLEHYLLENTDDENPITAEQLIQAYEDNGYKAHRNTIRDDIAVLQASGMDIISGSSGKYKTFCVGSRLFEPAEVKTLADAVASSRFITKEKSEGLIKKLTVLASIHRRRRLTQNALSANMIKTDTHGIFRTVDTITEAINRCKKISFQYIDYLPTKEKVLRHNGKVYTVSPYAMIWNDDRYYVPSYSEEKECVIPFRVDRMRSVKLLNEDAHKDLSFDPSEYSRKVLQMFNGNEEERTVTLIAENRYMLNLIDRFGEDIHTSIVDKEHFSADVNVYPSATFFAWVFRFRGGVRISEPDDVEKSYIDMLGQVIEAQKNLTSS